MCYLKIGVITYKSYLNKNLNYLMFPVLDLIIL